MTPGAKSCLLVRIFTYQPLIVPRKPNKPVPMRPAQQRQRHQLERDADELGQVFLPVFPFQPLDEEEVLQVLEPDDQLGPPRGGLEPVVVLVLGSVDHDIGQAGIDGQLPVL